jgi:Ca2+-binding RTX toxin-like protein
MAKVSFEVRMPDEVFIGQLDLAVTRLGRHNQKMADFSLPDDIPGGVPFTNVHMVFQGRGFKYEDGALVGGMVNKITYQDENGVDLAVYKGLNANIARAKATPELGLQDFLLKGDDILTGSRETEFLYGGPGDDIIKGLNGDDNIIGGRGDDTVSGAMGEDKFNFLNGAGPIGNDVITDFEPGLVVAAGVVQDLLIVDELPDLSKMMQVGANTIIDMGDGFSITLRNVLISDISADDFDVSI